MSDRGLTDEIRNDPEKFREWQRQQNEGPPLKSRPLRVPTMSDWTKFETDADYDAAQGSHFNQNGWGK